VVRVRSSHEIDGLLSSAQCRGTLHKDSRGLLHDWAAGYYRVRTEPLNVDDSGMSKGITMYLSVEGSTPPALRPNVRFAGF